MGCVEGDGLNERGERWRRRGKEAISNVPRPSLLDIPSARLKIKVPLTTRRYPERRYSENGGKVSDHSNDVEASFRPSVFVSSTYFRLWEKREGEKVSMMIGRGERSVYNEPSCC